jgi:hypothetical protein
MPRDRLVNLSWLLEYVKQNKVSEDEKGRVRNDAA